MSKGAPQKQEVPRSWVIRRDAGRGAGLLWSGLCHQEFRQLFKKFKKQDIPSRRKGPGASWGRDLAPETKHSTSG